MRNCTVILKSRVAGYGLLRRSMMAFGEAQGYSSGFLGTLELTLKEAFVNAVMHGNRDSGELPVIVLFRPASAGKSLEVTVRDCGAGFRPDDIPDPTSPHLLLKTSGRGVYIIRRYAEIVNVQTDSSGFSLTLRYTPF